MPSGETAPDPYEVLDVNKDASKQEIVEKYRELARVYHPDVGGTADSFSRLFQAWEILSDPQARENYDQGKIDGAGRRVETNQNDSESKDADSSSATNSTQEGHDAHESGASKSNSSDGQRDRSQGSKQSTFRHQQRPPNSNPDQKERKSNFTPPPEEKKLGFGCGCLIFTAALATVASFLPWLYVAFHSASQRQKWRNMTPEESAEDHFSEYPDQSSSNQSDRQGRENDRNSTTTKHLYWPASDGKVRIIQDTE